MGTVLLGVLLIVLVLVSPAFPPAVVAAIALAGLIFGVRNTSRPGEAAEYARMEARNNARHEAGLTPDEDEHPPSRHKAWVIYVIIALIVFAIFIAPAMLGA